MNKEQAEIVSRIFMWAYKNNIDVTLRKDHFYGQAEYPVLQFRRGDKNISQAFHRLDEIGPKMKFYWQQIACDLCVEPLDLEGLGEL